MFWQCNDAGGYLMGTETMYQASLPPRPSTLYHSHHSLLRSSSYPLFLPFPGCHLTSLFSAKRPLNKKRYVVWDAMISTSNATREKPQPPMIFRLMYIAYIYTAYVSSMEGTFLAWNRPVKPSVEVHISIRMTIISSKVGVFASYMRGRANDWCQSLTFARVNVA